jgi:hypothetical protein
MRFTVDRVTTTLVPLLPLLVVVKTSVWVDQDERKREAARSPVNLRIGAFSIDTAPYVWRRA